MNILIVAFDFKPNTGGIAEYTHQIARYLHLAGDNITVLSMKMEKDEEFDSQCDYRVLRKDPVLFSYLNNDGIRKFYQRYVDIKQITLDYRADLIICNALTSHPLACWLVAKSLGIPFCIFIYGLRVNESYYYGRSIKEVPKAFAKSMIRKIVVRGANLIFSCSSYTKKLISNLGVPNNKIVVYNPGIDIGDIPTTTNQFDSLYKTKSEINLINKKVILTVCRLVERKGIDKVFEALNHIREIIPNYVYIIVGNGPYRTTLDKLVSKYKLMDRVVFTGYVSEARKHQYYKMADIFVMPSLELDNGQMEGFGIVFLEANAFGKPVIGGRTGGISDAIVDGETGLLVDPLNTEELSTAIMKLLTNEQYAKILGEQGRKRVTRDFQWGNIALRARKDLITLIN